MDLGLTDRASIVTGGLRGIGLEVTDVIAFLCSKLAGNVVGAAWSIDGGAVPSIF